MPIEESQPDDAVVPKATKKKPTADDLKNCTDKQLKR